MHFLTIPRSSIEIPPVLRTVPVYRTDKHRPLFGRNRRKRTTEEIRVRFLCQRNSRIMKNKVLNDVRWSIFMDELGVRTPQSALSSPHSSVHTTESALPSPRSRVRTPQSALPSPRSRVRTPQSALPSTHSLVRAPESALLSPRSRVRTLQSTLPSPHSRVCAPVSALLSSRSRICTLEFAGQMILSASLFQNIGRSQYFHLLCKYGSKNACFPEHKKCPHILQ
ncbi:unnamed protein product, partial [Nesidiocoris tenuis]